MNLLINCLYIRTRIKSELPLLALPLSKGELEGVLIASLEETPLNPPLERGDGIALPLARVRDGRSE
jgi:hypothetical protein